MQLPRVRFAIWRSMFVIASVACFAAALFTFSDTRESGERVLFASVTLYGAPLALIVARGISLGRVAKIGGTIIVCGLPMVGFFAFFHPLVGLLVFVLVGWIALMAVALFPGTLGKLFDAMYAPLPITVGDPELPPLVYDPNWARPIKNRDEGFWDGHWIGFLFLLPFVVMFVLHELLGMTDALLMGDRVSANYNLMTLAAGFFGSLAFVIYAFVLPIVKERGWGWLPAKIIFLVSLWGAAFLSMRYMRLLHP
jgi:hypothetical protein